MPLFAQAEETNVPGGAWLSRLAAAVVVCALLLGAAIAFFHLGFETNDDVAMLKLAAGLYDGRPSQYLILINVALGLLLKSLYQHVSHVPWYEILLLTVHFLSLSLLLFTLFLRRFSWRTLLLFVSFFLTFELVILCRMSYTTTAFVAAMSGILLMVAACSMEKPFPGMVFAVAGGCLLVLAGMVRLYSLWLALLLSIPFLLAVERRLRLRVWITIGLATVASFGFMKYSHHLHRQAGWADYLEQDHYRWRLQDTPRLAITEETRPHFDEAGWAEHEIALFRYFLYDDRVFSPAVMKRLSERLVTRRSLHDAMGAVGDALAVHKITFLLAAVLAGLVLLLAERRARWIMILTAGWSLVVFLGLVYAAKPPFRVVHSLIVFDAAVAIFLLCFSGGLRQTPGLRRWTVAAIIALLAAGTLVQSFRMLRESERNRIRGQMFAELAVALSRLQPDAVIVPYGGTYPLPLFVDLDKLKSPRSIPGGWLINSPIYHTLKRNLGVAEVHEALLRREHCYLLVDQRMDDHLREHLPPFFKRHYGAAISFETVGRAGDCILYRLVSRDTGASRPVENP